MLVVIKGCKETVFVGSKFDLKKILKDSGVKTPDNYEIFLVADDQNDGEIWLHILGPIFKD